MPIEIVLLLLAATCVAAAIIAMGRQRRPRSWGHGAWRNCEGADSASESPCRPARSGTARRNALILGIFGLAFVIGVHLVEGRSTRDTIQQILEKEIPGKPFEVDAISFPSSYSAPFLARMDLTPSRVKGSFRLTRPAGQKGCVGGIFTFELQPHSVNFLISIPDEELTKIRLCLSS